MGRLRGRGSLRASRRAFMIRVVVDRREATGDCGAFACAAGKGAPAKSLGALILRSGALKVDEKRGP